MDYVSGIMKAVRKAGGPVALAETVGVSYEAVRRWQRGLSRISTRHALVINEKLRVSKSALRPDFWGRR